MLLRDAHEDLLEINSTKKSIAVVENLVVNTAETNFAEFLIFLLQTTETGLDCDISTADFYNILVELEELVGTEDMTGGIIIMGKTNKSVINFFQRLSQQVPNIVAVSLLADRENYSLIICFLKQISMNDRFEHFNAMCSVMITRLNI